MSIRRATSIFNTERTTARSANSPLSRANVVAGVAVLGIFFLALAGRCEADIYLDFSGSNASGAVNGVPFSGASWLFEAQIDTSVANSAGTPGLGAFNGAIVGASIRINGVDYSLSGSSATGNVATTEQTFFGYQGNEINLNPGIGGYLQFITGGGGLFPSLFSNYASLASYNLGAVAVDNTTDDFANKSVLSFGYVPSDDLDLGPGHHGLQSSAFDQIDITDVGSPAGGTFRLSVGSSSAFGGSSGGGAVPEPASIGIWGMLVGGSALVSYQRRRAAKKVRCVETPIA